MLELARTGGAFYLHGAALLQEGQAEVVCAAGGTGKSTLAAAWHAQGRPVLTDDAACLISGEPPLVAALPGPWRLSGPAAAWCGLPRSPHKTPFWPDVPEFDRAPIRRLWFAEQAPQSSRSLLRPGEALARLVRQNPLLLACQPLAQPHLDALAALVDRSPAYHLALGPELLGDPALVLNLLTV